MGGATGVTEIELHNKQQTAKTLNASNGMVPKTTVVCLRQ